MREPVTNVAVALAAAVGLLLLLEAGARTVWPPPRELSADVIWEAQRPESYGKDRFRRARAGGFHFREPAPGDSVFAPSTWRVLFLGDSFTAGDGIESASDRFSDLIEERLNSAFVAGERAERVHLFNAGKSGANPDQWLRFFTEIEPLYHPHAVFAIFFLRDGTRLGTSLRFNRELIAPIRARYEAMPLYGSSRLMRTIYTRFAWRDYTRMFKRKLISSYLGSERERAEWTRQQAALLQIAERCCQGGIAFHLIIFPMLFDLKDYEFGAVEEQIEDFARRNRLALFSLTPGFIGRDERSLWVASNDQHPNEEGHRIAAQTLLPYVEESLRALSR